MDGAFLVKKRLILFGLGVLFIGDLALAGYSWQAATAMSRPMGDLEAESRKLGLLNADIERSEKIRHDLPATVADCDRFEALLLPAVSGDSAVAAELDELAKKSGLQIQSLTLRHKEVSGHNLTAVDMDTAVHGEYFNIVKFMNGLQRSKNLYIVESLNLQPQGQGGNPSSMQIALHMRTYFRNGA